MQEDAVDPGGVLSRAAELGVMSLLGSAPGPLSLEELLSAGSGGGASSNDLEAIMGALVELKVVEETEQPNKAYRLRPGNLPPGSETPNAAGAGGEQASEAGHDAPDVANEAPPYQEQQEGSMEQHSTMIPYTEAQMQAQQQAIAYAQQMGYAPGSMYPMYPVYGSPPPQYYPPGTSVPSPGSANAAAEGQPNFGGFQSPVTVPSGGYMYGAMPMPGADGSGMVSPTWVPQGSGGSFTGVPPPPPPPRCDSASSPSSNAQGWPQSLDEPAADASPQPSSSGNAPCAFFLKTGTCAYGDKCKFEHPAGRQPPRLNSMGYPVRPGEPDCVYFMKRGMCGFGITCKFNHPEINPARPPGAAVQQGQGPAAAAAAAAAAAQWQQHMMQPGMMQHGMMPLGGPAGMMQGHAGMLPMMPYAPHMARAHGAAGSAPVQPGPGGQPGYPPGAVMPGASPPVMMVPVPSLPSQQQQQRGKPINAASSNAPSAGASNKGSSSSNNKNNNSGGALGSYPTQHLHEILGISPSPSLASSDGVRINGAIVSSGSWTSDSATNFGSSAGSANTHMSVQSGDQMHWEMQHSQRQQQQQGHHGRGGRRRGGNKQKAAPAAGSAAPGDTAKPSSSKPDKSPEPLSASAAAAAAAAAKESLSPTKKAAAASPEQPQQQPSTPAAAGAEGGSPSYSPGFGSAAQLPAAVSTPLTATS